MTQGCFRVALIGITLAIMTFGSPGAVAQGYPAACKPSPSGTYACKALTPTAYQYQAPLCMNAFFFPSPAETAVHFADEAFPAMPGCPDTLWQFLRWADNERRVSSGGGPDVDFSVHCSGEGSGPYPLTYAGKETVNYALYQVTRYMSPNCEASTGSMPTAFVVRSRSMICPDGYGRTGVDPDVYCVRDDYDAGKNLGCPKKAEGACSDGNPINTGNGNKYQIETDYTGAGPNPLRFQRFYNSHAGRSTAADGVHRFGSTNSAAPIRAFLDPDQLNGTKAMAADSIGVNWRHTYQRGVVESDTPSIRSVSLYREDGRVLVFNEYGGSWVADGDVNFTVTELTDVNGTTGWEVKTPSDSTETYSAIGQLLTIADRAGVTVTVTYDSVGRIDKVTDQFGRELDFTYAANPQTGFEWWEQSGVVNQLISVSDPLGNTYTYDYNSDGTLKSVTYPDTNVRQYKYENAIYPFALTAIIDGNSNQFATFGYDSMGRGNLSYHGQGNDVSGRLDVTYTNTSSSTPYYSIASTSATFAQGSSNPRSRSTLISRRLGVAKMDSSTQGSTSESRTYDANGNVVRHTDLNGNTVYRTYNSRNLVTLRREAENDPLQRDTTTTWHPTHRLPDVIAEPNRTIDYDYDANGNVERVTITSLNTSGSEDLSIDGNRTRIWNYQYNGYGQVTSIDGPRVDVADVTTLDYYDEPTCPVGDGKCGQLEFIIDAEGNRTDFNEYYADGLLKKMTDPNGLETLYEYDSRRRLTRVTLTDGVTSRVTTYAYDSAGQLDLVSYPDGLTLDYAWTSAHLLDHVEDNFGNRIDYEYDAHGRRSAENRRDPAGVIRDALATTYDQFGFVDTVTNGTSTAGNAITTDYDYDPLGNLDRVTDANAKVTDYFVDALGRAHKVKDALSNDTDYSYDSQGNVDMVTTPNGATTSLPHDGLGNLDQEVSSDRGAIDHDYDDAGNLRIRLDALGQQTQYTYDKLNRLTMITLDSGATIVYQYDTGTNAKGRLNKITDSSGQTTWTYNKFGDITSKTQTIGTVVLTTDYQYLPNGLLEWMRLPSGKTIYYGYSVFLLDSVAVDTEVVLNGAKYEPFGPIKEWTWGNAMANTRSYDTRGLLVGQTLLSDTRVLGYDSVGRLTSVDDGRQSPGFDYSTLIPSDGSYDYSVVPASNQLDVVPGPISKNYDYDAAGNVTSDGVHSYTYDDWGRLVSVDGGVTATYQHNGQGQRVKKVSGSATTLFVYDEAGHLIGEYTAAGAPVLEHVWFNGEPVAVIDGNETYYVHTDHLGTPRSISDGATEIWRWLSTPFGTHAADEDPDGNLATFTYHLRFPGQYYDSETGLHYNYFRDYDPATGKYMESDPIGLAGGNNTYAYVMNNPLQNIDPEGLIIMQPFSIFRTRPGAKRSSRGKCEPADWEYCREYCGCRGVLRCAVYKTPKFKKLNGPITRYDMEREVRCECADDQPGSELVIEPDPWWWVLPLLILIPPTGVPG